jgi:hypothetical protein
MAILAPIALLLMVALVPIHIGSRASMAAVGPLAVDGIIYSSGGIPVVGATVVVSIFDGLTFRAASLPFTSDSNGFYAVSFGGSEWDIGNRIVVVATHGSDIGQNETVADFDFQTIDVHLGTVIPELGGPVTTALTVSAIGMMVVFYARRRRPESP